MENTMYQKKKYIGKLKTVRGTMSVKWYLRHLFYYSIIPETNFWYFDIYKKMDFWNVNFSTDYEIY